jgi:CRP/FNR family cyclic AMP-dependent transcriptional regulator
VFGRRDTRDTPGVEGLLALAEGFPRRQLEAGSVLLVDGGPVEALYVLLDGSLRIEKAGVSITTLATPGACVGEMSLLLGVPATADVVAAAPTVVVVIKDARTMLEPEGGLTLALGRLLAERLQVMTTYLADLKRQYADHEGGLGMVDVVLGSLMQGSGSRTELRSERDPDPEY